MKIRKHWIITDEVMDALYKHAPSELLARLHVANGVTRIATAEEISEAAVRLESA